MSAARGAGARRGGTKGKVPHPADLTPDQRRRFLLQLQRDLHYKVLPPREAEERERADRLRVGRLALRGVLARLPEVLLRHERDAALRAALDEDGPLHPAGQALVRRCYAELVGEVLGAVDRLALLDVDPDLADDLPDLDDHVEGAALPPTDEDDPGAGDDGRAEPAGQSSSGKARR